MRLSAPRLLAAPAIALLAGCANSPPPAGLALLAPGNEPEAIHFFSLNILSNYGRTGYSDGREVERSDGYEVVPTYENRDDVSGGAVFTAPFMYLGAALVNLQPQVTAGLRWDERIALGYFPTFSLNGKRVLHGIQLDLRVLPSLAAASVHLYEENLASILPNPGMGEAGPVLTHAVAGASLHLSVPIRKWRIGLVPNWRRSLDYPLYRYGVNLVFSGTEPIKEKDRSGRHPTR